MPTVLGYGNSDFSGQGGVATIGLATETAVKVKNNAGYRVMMTLHETVVKPASLMEGLQVSVNATVCEKKL